MTNFEVCSQPNLNSQEFELRNKDKPTTTTVNPKLPTKKNLTLETSMTKEKEHIQMQDSNKWLMKGVAGVNENSSTNQQLQPIGRTQSQNYKAKILAIANTRLELASQVPKNNQD